MYVVKLPWPPKEVHPNFRTKKHMVKAKATKLYRSLSAWEAKAWGVKPAAPDSGISVEYVFVPPDKRRRDWDGLIASLKAAQDGIADVIGIDDYYWRTEYRIEPYTDPDKRGYVIANITVSEAGGSE